MSLCSFLDTFGERFIIFVFLKVVFKILGSYGPF